MLPVAQVLAFSPATVIEQPMALGFYLIVRQQKKTIMMFSRWSFSVLLLLHCVSIFLLQKVAAYAEEKNVLFLETSAKTNLNVTDIFLQIGE